MFNILPIINVDVIKKSFFAMLAIVLTSSVAIAAAKTSEVENYVNNLVNKSVSILDNPQLDSESKYSEIKNIMTRNLDTNWMAKFTLGRKVKAMPKDKVELFTKTYSKYLVSTYAKGINEYRGQSVEVKSYDKLREGFYIVKTHLIGHGDNPIHIDYLVKKTNDEYKVRDVITEGISMVNSQRVEYASAVENHGIEHLISELSKRSGD